MRCWKLLLHVGSLGLGMALGISFKSAPQMQPVSAADELKVKPASAGPMLSPLEWLRSRLRQGADVSGEAKTFNSLAISDFPEALYWVLAHPIPAERNELLGMLFSAWGRSDRAGALVALMRLASPQAQALAVSAILKDWVLVDQAAAWAWVTVLPSDGVLQMQAIEVLLPLTAATEPERYASWAESLEDPLLRARALELVVGEWMKTDARAPLDWLRGVEPARLRTQLFSDYIFRVKEWSDLQRLEVAYQWPDRSVRLQTAPSFLSEYANRDPAAATAWLLAQPKTPELQRFSYDLGGMLCRRSSLAELRAVAMRLPVGTLRDAFISGSLGYDPFESDEPVLDRARALLPLVGQGPERLDVLSAIARSLANQDLVRAEAWVQSLPPGLDQGAGIRGLAQSLRIDHYSQTLDLLSQVTDDLPGTTGMIERIFVAWCEHEPSKANAWLESNAQLSTEQREHFRALTGIR